MRVSEVIEYFGVAPFLLQKMKDEKVRRKLDALCSDCLKVRANYEIVVDDSPVMESPESFAAKIERKSKKIILNGHVLAKTFGQDIVRDFLIFHELGHEVLTAPAFGKDIDLEQCCDLIALHAISQKYSQLNS